MRYVMPQSTLDETCENCRNVIGRLETPMVYTDKLGKDRVVCEECYGKLMRKKTPALNADAIYNGYVSPEPAQQTKSEGNSDMGCLISLIVGIVLIIIIAGMINAAGFMATH